MAEAKRDGNFVTTLLAVSSVDGVTPIALYANPTTHRLLVDLAGGTGTVTDMTIVTANGFAGTVATSTTTPAVTLTTTITGLLKGNGTAISAAVSGTDIKTVNGTSLIGSGDVAVSASVGGSNTQIQYNNAGALGGASGITTNGLSALTLGINVTTIGTIKMFGNTSGDVTIQPTAAAGTATVQTLPTVTGTLVNRVTTANGVSASNTDGAFTVTLGAITPTTVNGNTITTGSGVLTLGAGKTLTISNTLTLAGTDATTMTFPTTTATIARTDAGQTFTGVQTMTSPSITTSIVTGSTSFDAFNTTATTLNIGGASTTLNLGGTPTTTATFNLGTNATAAATTKTVNLGTGGAASSTTNVNIGATPGGTTTVNSPAVSLGGVTGVTTTGTIELGNATDTTLSRSSAGVLAVEGVVVPSISSTNTFTNKRVTKRITALSANSATPAINTDSTDVVNITAQTTAITSFTTSLTGTPVDGDTLRISVTGTASIALTFGTSFVATTVALPTTTSGTIRLDMGFIWNSATTKWLCVAVA